MTRGQTGARLLFLAVMLLIPVFIIGLSIASYLVELNHSRITQQEAHALTVIRAVNRANLILDEQRLLVARSVYQPLPRALFLQYEREFRQLIAQPVLRRTLAGPAAVEALRAEYDDMVQAALALPRVPTHAQVAAVDRQAGQVVRLLDSIRSGYSANLGAVISTEYEQRRASMAALLVSNLVVLTLVAAALVLVGRLGREQARAAALEASDRLRNEFVAFAAHELRNPASAIKAGAWLLQQPHLPEPDRAKAVEAINRSADALSRLVLNLLTMGRIEEGRLHLELRPTSLQILVGELLEEMAVYHPDLPGRVELAAPAEQVQVDPEYVKLALSNVLDNALRYSPPGSPIHITGETGPQMVIVHVRDEGAGIPPERLPHIFDKYETTGEAPYATRTGVGLGLYLSRLLIEAHGGRIWAESTLGEGTTISFTLPHLGPSAIGR